MFADETGYMLQPTVMRTWARRGQTPTLREVRGSWGKLNQIAAIAVSPRWRRFRCFWQWKRGKSFVGEDIASFVRELLRELRGPVILIWDGLPGHRSEPIKELLRERGRRLHIEPLPSYAPELNPVEHLNSLGKRRTANHGCRDLDELFDLADGWCCDATSEQRVLRRCIDATPLGQCGPAD